MRCTLGAPTTALLLLLLLLLLLPPPPQIHGWVTGFSSRTAIRMLQSSVDTSIYLTLSRNTNTITMDTVYVPSARSDFLDILVTDINYNTVPFYIITINTSTALLFASIPPNTGTVYVYHGSTTYNNNRLVVPSPTKAFIQTFAESSVISPRCTLSFFNIDSSYNRNGAFVITLPKTVLHGYKLRVGGYVSSTTTSSSTMVVYICNQIFTDTAPLNPSSPPSTCTQLGSVGLTTSTNTVTSSVLDLSTYGNTISVVVRFSVGYGGSVYAYLQSVEVLDANNNVVDRLIPTTISRCQQVTRSSTYGVQVLNINTALHIGAPHSPSTAVAVKRLRLNMDVFNVGVFPTISTVVGYPFYSNIRLFDIYGNSVPLYALSNGTHTAIRFIYPSTPQSMYLEIDGSSGDMGYPPTSNVVSVKPSIVEVSTYTFDNTLQRFNNISALKLDYNSHYTISGTTRYYIVFTPFTNIIGVATVKNDCSVVTAVSSTISISGLDQSLTQFISRFRVVSAPDMSYNPISDRCRPELWIYPIASGTQGSTSITPSATAPHRFFNISAVVDNIHKLIPSYTIDPKRLLYNIGEIVRVSIYQPIPLKIDIVINDATVVAGATAVPQNPYNYTITVGSSMYVFRIRYTYLHTLPYAITQSPEAVFTIVPVTMAGVPEVPVVPQIQNISVEPVNVSDLRIRFEWISTLPQQLRLGLSYLALLASLVFLLVGNRESAFFSILISALILIAANIFSGMELFNPFIIGVMAFMAVLALFVGGRR